MKRKLRCLLLTCLAVSVVGCSLLTNRNIGEPFEYTWSTICTWNSLPASCSIPSRHFTFNFDVEHLPNGEYTLNGYAFVTEEGKRLEDLERATFTFLLGKEGIIFDAVQHTVIAGDLRSKLPLRKQFTSQRDFDALFVTYEVIYSSSSDETDSFYQRRLEPEVHRHEH